MLSGFCLIQRSVAPHCLGQAPLASYRFHRVTSPQLTRLERHLPSQGHVGPLERSGGRGVWRRIGRRFRKDGIQTL
jgi:hypothetical protein